MADNTLRRAGGADIAALRGADPEVAVMLRALAWAERPDDLLAGLVGEGEKETCERADRRGVHERRAPRTQKNKQREKKQC